MFVPAVIEEQPTCGPAAAERSGGIIEIEIGGSLVRVGHDADADTVAQPIDYILKRWGAFARFLDDGRICLTNSAAERALRGFALGRKSWLFAGSECGADRAAAMATLITTAKLNDIDPLAWLADVLAHIADMPQSLGRPAVVELVAAAPAR